MLRCCLYLVVALLATPLAFGLRTVSREVPSIYAEKLQPLLTPVEDVLAGKSIFPDNPDGGVILLRESIHYVDSEGVTYRLVHSIAYTRRESGIPGNERDIFRFDKERQEIYLVEAYTLDEAGNTQHLDDNAAFIHSPQEGASRSLYSSDEELVLVYPGVRTGVVTVSTVLYLEHTAVIPGEFATNRWFQSGWPSYRIRFVLEMPEAMRERLNVISSGVGVPVAVETAPEAGRKRLEWALPAPVDDRNYEDKSPTWDFVVPNLWLSTLDNWDAVARWHRDGTVDRRQPGEELRSVVDAATGGLTERSEILQAVTSLVSDKVRYTGLEFGMAGYVPYDCNSVWKNGYGDCKDKANLLASLLTYRGIPAWTALVNTESHGLVERRSPGVGQFDHMIVAVPEADGTFLIIDPTVEQLPVGLQPQSVMARDILVLTDQGAVWTRGEEQLQSGYLFEIDAKLDRQGALSGWMRLEEKGSSAAAFADSMNKQHDFDRLEKMHDYASAYFPGVRTLDVDYEPVFGPVGEASARAYFERDAGAGTADSLPFPFPSNWLPDLMAKEDRTLPYEASLYRSETVARITLPQGRRPVALPEPFVAKSDAFNFEGSWSLDEEGRLVARLDWAPSKLVLQPDEFQAYRRAVFAVKAWLARPVLLEDGDAAATAVAPATGDLDFPLLATGQGQMRLLERRYPKGKDDALRRRALQQVIQWFPDDFATLADARTYLVNLDWTEDAEDSRVAAEAFRAILTDLEAKMDTDTSGWVRSLEARSRWLATGDPTALDLLETLARDEAQSAYRRQWSAYQCARFLSDTESERAVAVIKAVSLLRSDVLDDLDRVQLRILLKQNDSAAVFEHLFAVSARGEGADAELAVLLGSLSEEWSNLSAPFRAQLTAGLQSELDANRYGSSATAKVQEILLLDKASEHRQALAADLRALLETTKPAWRVHAEPTAGEDAHYQKLKDSEGAARINAALDLLTLPSGDADRFAEALHLLAVDLVNTRPAAAEDVADALSVHIADLPLDSKCYVARTAINLSHFCEDLSELEATIARLSAFQKRDGLENWINVTLGIRKIEILLRHNRTAEALDAAQAVLPIADSSTHGSDIPFYVMALALQQGDLDLAASALQPLGVMGVHYVNGAKFGRLTLALHNADTAKHAETVEYWKFSERWWPAWEALCKKYDVEPAKGGDVLRMKTPGEWGQDTQRAAATGKPSDYLTQLRPVIQGVRVSLTSASYLRELIFNTNGLPEPFVAELKALYLKISDGWTFGSPTERDEVLVVRADLLEDGTDVAAARDLAKEIYERQGAGTFAGAAGLRIWLLAGKTLNELDEPVKKMNRVLKSGKPVHRRDFCIRVLSDSYEHLKDRAGHKRLLASERKYLEDTKAESVLNTLKERAAKADAVPLEEIVQEWIAAYCQDWFDSALPRSVDDLESMDDGRPLTSGDGIGDSAKIKLLYALDAKQPEVDRQVQFRQAINLVLPESLPPGEYREAVLATLADERLTGMVRADVWTQAIDYAVKCEDATFLASLLESPAVAVVRNDFVQRARTSFKFLKAFRAASPDQLKAVIEVLKDTEFDLNTQEQVGRLIDRLVYLGREGEAECVLETCEGAKVASFVNGGLPAMKLAWRQRLRVRVEEQSFNSALREMVETHCGPLPTEEPPCFPLIPDLRWTRWVSPAELRTAALFGIASGRLKGAQPEELIGILREAKSPRVVSLLSLDVLAYAVERPTVPVRQAGRLLDSMQADTDHEEFRNVAVSVFQKLWDTPGMSPRVRTIAWGRLAYWELRFSDEARPSMLYSADVPTTLGRDNLNEMHLIYALNRGIDAEVERLLAETAPGQATSPDGLITYFLAYRKAGMDAEAGLVRDWIAADLESLAREDSLCARPWAWIDGLELAWVIGETDFMPVGTERILSQKVGAEGFASWRFRHALMKGDWEQVDALATAYLATEPEMYTVYGPRALARAHLGRLEEAAADIEVWRTWNRNSAFYTAIIDAYEAAVAARNN